MQPDLARNGLHRKAVKQAERKKLKRMKRSASLRRSPSQLKERDIIGALERVPSDWSGKDTADAIIVPQIDEGDHLSAPGTGETSNDASEGSNASGMGLGQRRALWESTLPRKMSALPPRHHSPRELANIAESTWIEADRSPTIPYGVAGRTTAKPEKITKVNTVKLPFFY